MKRLQFMPYVLVFFSICMSTIIAVIRHIDFITFFKKAIVFFLIIFFSSKIFVNVIINVKNEKTEEYKNNKQNPISASDETDNDELEKDAFQPLKFEANKIENPSKSISNKFGQS